jgi:hypothetical protein
MGLHFGIKHCCSKMSIQLGAYSIILKLSSELQKSKSVPFASACRPSNFWRPSVRLGVTALLQLARPSRRGRALMRRNQRLMRSVVPLPSIYVICSLAAECLEEMPPACYSNEREFYAAISCLKRIPAGLERSG